MAAIRETVDGYPGIERSLQTYLRDKVGEVLTGESRALVVRIYGQQRDVLRQKAEQVRQALAGIKGIVDLHAEGQAEEPQVQVKVNLDAAGRASVKPGDVRRASATVFSGLVVGYLFKEQKIYEVVVWGAPEARQSLTNLGDLWIDKAGPHPGAAAAMSPRSASCRRRPSSGTNGSRRMSTSSPTSPGAIRARWSKKSRTGSSTIQFPLEYHPELLGEYAERQVAQRRMLGVAVAAMIGIFLLLQACFRSWRLALIAFLALPASIAGGVLAALVSGGTISLGSIVGFLAVLGISARNGVELINHYQCLERDEGVPFGLDLVLRGTRERLSPILASAAAIIAALLPIALLGWRPGLEIVQPTVFVILGGLIAATLFTLFVIPPLYLITGAGAGPKTDLGLAEAP